MLRLISRFFPLRARRKPAPVSPEILLARRSAESGETAKAEQICKALIGTDPPQAAAYDLLGAIAVKQGRHNAAVEYFMKAVAIDPQPGFQQNLAMAHCNLGQFSAAIRCFEKILAAEPTDSAVLSNLGNCHLKERRVTKAIRCYRKAISANPSYLLAYINLADAFQRQKDRTAAIKTYRKALRNATGTAEHQGNIAILHHRLGLALRQQEKTDEAIENYRAAIAHQPDFALAHNSLGVALLARNEATEAMTCFRRTMQLDPGYSNAHSNLLLVMNYLPGLTQKQIYKESLQFDTRYARRLLKNRKPFPRSGNKKKRIRAGYLSPDFRDHSVAYFTRKLLGRHDRNAIEVYCYACVETPDDTTGQFQAQADHWVPITSMHDEEVAARIRRDGIDILVDLTGHTSNNRLLIFARKPAPIQVAWLGYPNTTGMRTIDYRLTDALVDPPGDADRLHTETLVRLEHGFLCYQTDDSIPLPSTPPCAGNGYITFGSFNTILKETPEVVRIWSQILQSIPDSRLVLKSHALEDEETKNRLLRAYAEHGISSERIDLVNTFRSRRQHMTLYSTIDIALDPFPYNGTTTTFEALWMGVPVICLRGKRHASRVSASIMQRIGLPQLIADSQDGYVEAARRLADNTGELQELRNALRARIQESSLMNLPLFTKTLENAYRRMWAAWCNNKRQ